MGGRLSIGVNTGGERMVESKATIYHDDHMRILIVSSFVGFCCPFEHLVVLPQLASVFLFRQHRTGFPRLSSLWVAFTVRTGRQRKMQTDRSKETQTDTNTMTEAETSTHSQGIAKPQRQRFNVSVINHFQEVQLTSDSSEFND